MAAFTILNLLRGLWILLIFIVIISTSENCPKGFHPFLSHCVQNQDKLSFASGCQFMEPLPMKYLKQYILKVNESFWVPTKFNSDLGYFEWLEKDKWFGSPLNLNDFKPQPRLFKYENLEEDCLVDATGEKKGDHYKPINCQETNYHFCAYKRENNFCTAFQNITNQEPISLQMVTNLKKEDERVNFTIDCSICLCLDEFQSKFFCAMDICDKINVTIPKQIFLGQDLSSGKASRLAFGKDMSSSREEGQINKLCETCQKTYQDYEVPTLKLMKTKNDIYLIITSPLKLKISDHSKLPFSCLYDFQYMKGYNYNWMDDEQINSILIYKDTQKQIYQLKVYVFIGRPMYPIVKLWCVGFKYPDMVLVKSNSIIAGKTPIFNSKTNVTVSRILKDQPLGYLAQYNFSYGMPTNFSIYVQPLTAHKNFIKDTNDSFEVTVRVLIDNQPHPAEDSYENLTKIFYQHEIYSSHRCLSETEYLGDEPIIWPLAFIGQTVLSSKACTDHNNIFVTRTCHGDIMDKTFWNTQGTCTKFPSFLITDELQNLLNSNSNAHVKTLKLRDILMIQQNFLPEDVYLASKVLDDIIESHDNLILQTILETIGNLMDLDENVLRLSQESLNATDKIIGNLEKVLEEVTNVSIGYDLNLDTTNILIQTVDLKNGYVSGWAVYKDNMISVINRDTYIHLLDKRDLMYAIKVPTELLAQILNFAEKNKSSDPIVLVGSFYKKPSLFQPIPRVLETQNFKILKPISWTSNIFVAGFTQPFFNSPIQILVPSFRRYKQQIYCAFWDYGFHDNASSKTGAWVIESNAIGFDQFYMCEFWHMAHFALVLEPDPNRTLDYFVLSAAFVSGLISLGIIVYTIFFKTCQNWRNDKKEVGTSIIFNYSLTVLVKVSGLAANDFIDSCEEQKMCLIIAVILHYIFISQLCWVTTINYLQYKKTVCGKTQISSDFLRNSLFIGWIVPALPVAINVSLGTSCYLMDDFCFVTDNELQFSLMVPRYILTGMNLIISVRVWIFLKRSKLISWCRGFDSNGSIYQNVPYKLIVLIILFYVFSSSFSIINGFARDDILGGLYCLFECLTAFSVLLLYAMWNGSFEMLMGKVRDCFWKINCKRSAKN